MQRAKGQMHSRISNQIRHTTIFCASTPWRHVGIVDYYFTSSLRNKLHGNFLSVAVFFFLFNCLYFFSFLFCAQMHETTSAEQKIKTVFHLLFSSSSQDIPTRLRTKINNRATAKPTTPSSTNGDVLMHGKLSMPRCIQAASCALYAAGCRHCRRLLILFFRCSFPRCDLIYK